MFGRLFAIAAVLALTGCAAQPVAPEKLSTIKTMGVIVALGDEITLTNSGILVFTNGESHGSLAPWGIDDTAMQKVTAFLSRRFDVRPLVYDRAAFAPDKLYWPETEPMISGLVDPSRKRVETVIGDSVQPQGFDAYVLVSLAWSHVGATNQVVTGLGLLEAHSLFYTQNVIHALYSITVFDGHTHKIIGRSLARPVHPGVLASSDVLQGPFQGVDSSWEADSFDKLSEPQRQQLRSAIGSLIDEMLVPTLQGLKLID